MGAWIFQDPKQVKKHGEARASYYVGWFDPDGKKCSKSCGAGSGGKRKAEMLQKQLDAELLTGTYSRKREKPKTWAEFRAEYDEKIVAKKAARSRVEMRTALDHLGRIVKPRTVQAVTTQAVDAYVAQRRREPGKKKGDAVSPATINKELRHIKAALKKAAKWGYAKGVPDVDFEREPKKLARYIPPEDFAAIYAACEAARMPDGFPFSAAAWWRALLVTGYMTGWRINAMLALKREDVDLADGTATSWADDKKGGRDNRIKLHESVVDHVRQLAAFDPHVFPWNHDERTLWEEFRRIQEAAGIKLACRGRHEHTPACHVYGFHDLRRAFATLNAPRLTADMLQHLMQHKSYTTTQKYINMNRQQDDAVASLFVPKLPGRGKVQ